MFHVVRAQPEASGPVPNTVPTNSAIPQYPWYEHLNVDVWFQSAHGAAPTKVGSLAASILRRDRIPGRFGESMSLFVSDTEVTDVDTAETEELTLCFEFDDLAHFPRSQLESIRTEGTGVWGAEINRGDIVIVENIFVDPFRWRQGIGRRLVQVLTDVLGYKSAYYTLLARPVFLSMKTFDAVEQQAPGTLTPQSKQEIRASAERLPLDFWHAQGLRRVGLSEWLARSSDPAHPASHIPENQDAEFDAEACYQYDN